jgi:hypothetical protein
MSRLLLRGRLKAVAAVSWQLIHSPSTRKDQRSNPPMKTSFLGLPCWLFLIHVAASQEIEPAVEKRPSAVIADPVSAMTQESPAKVVSKLVIAPEDVLETKVHDLGDRRITTQKLSPIELPLIPAPPPPPDPLDPAVQARMEALGAKYAKTTFVMIGATVYQSASFPDGARTRLTIQGQKGGLVTCWSSADWELLGGTGGFVDQEGRKYALIMICSRIDLDRWADFVTRRGGNYVHPVVPAIPPGEATFVVSSGDPSPAALAALGALHELYNKDLEVLKARRNARNAEHLAREAERRANPPQPKDIVIRHWRMDEAGQQGITPKPAVTR